MVLTGHSRLWYSSRAIGGLDPLREYWQQRWEMAWREIVDGGINNWRARLVRGGLRVLSWPYRWAVCTRNWFYDHHWFTVHTAAVPVVSVGNLSVGGTGKTPCIEYIARYYRQRDLRVAIVSRGYGAVDDRNDESLVLEENLPDVPHLQHPDRVAAAECAVEELDTQIIVLDDGFQHRRLHRDLDIVLVDATRPPTRDMIFPRGTLREPLSTLKRSDCIIITRCDQITTQQLNDLRHELMRKFSNKPIVLAVHRAVSLRCGTARSPLDALKGRPIVAFCGLARPESFRHTLRQLGAELLDCRIYPDHYSYSHSDVDCLKKWAAGTPKDTWIITTQKDWVKLRLDQLEDKRLWVLEIQFEIIEGSNIFHTLLDRVPLLLSANIHADELSETLPLAVNSRGCATAK